MNKDTSELWTFPHMNQSHINSLNYWKYTWTRLHEILKWTIFVPENNAEILSRFPKKFVSIQSNMQVAIDEAMEIKKCLKQPIVIWSAIDTNLKDYFFDNPNFISFAWTIEHEGVIYTVWTTKDWLNQILNETNQQNEQIKKEALLRTVLKSDKCKKVIVHALWPKWTNISLVADKYIDLLWIRSKSEIVIYGKWIEPQDYSENARNLQDNCPDWIIHLHIECAVFYWMRDLYEKRSDEIIFADEFHMKLDNMQLVSNNTTWKIDTILSHPSPKSLAIWLWSEILKASSNSAALSWMLQLDADACITTQSSIDLLDKNSTINHIHTFGAPNMVFTIWTPLSRKQLQNYI